MKEETLDSKKLFPYGPTNKTPVYFYITQANKDLLLKYQEKFSDNIKEQVSKTEIINMALEHFFKLDPSLEGNE